MKRIIFLILALLAVLASLPDRSLAATQDDPLVVDLIAGQHTDVGDIKVWDDGTTLYVQYETVDPWCMTETHLAVASSLSDIPQANGNPIPGQFPYKKSFKCETSY